MPDELSNLPPSQGGQQAVLSPRSSSDSPPTPPRAPDPEPEPSKPAPPESDPSSLIQTAQRKKEEPPPMSEEEQKANDAAYEDLKSNLPELLYGTSKAEPAEGPSRTEEGSSAGEKGAKAKQGSDASEKPPAKTSSPGRRSRVLPEEAPEEGDSTGAGAEPSATEAEDARIERLGRSIADAIRAGHSPEEARRLAAQGEPAPGSTSATQGTGEDPQVSHLTEADREDYAAFQELETAYPDRYKGVAKSFLDFVKKDEEYRRQWEKENPGERFDPNAEDHEAFYEKHQPKYTQRDLERARGRVEARKLLEEERQKLDEKYQKLESEVIGTKIEKEVQQLAQDATMGFIERLPDEWKTVIKEKGVEAFQEEDPVAYEVLNRSALALQEQVRELKNIAKRPRYFDGNNPVHSQLAQFAYQKEQELLKRPAKQRVWEGKEFVPRLEYQKMSDAEKSRHWTLEEQDIVDLLIHAHSQQAQEQITQERERIEQLAQRYGYTKSGQAATNAPQKGGKAPAPPANTDKKKPNSPASGVGDAVPPTTEKSEPPPKNNVDGLFETLWPA